MRAKFCIVGTGAGGGMLAYRLALSGADVLVINSGRLPTQSEFKNEMSPEQKGSFEIHRDTHFPARAEISLVHPLIAEAPEKSSIPHTQDGFHHYQIHHVNGLQNLWNGISLRYSEDDFSNRYSNNDQCVWPITYKDMERHYSEVETLANVIGKCDQNPQFPDGAFQPPKAMREVDQIFVEGNKKLFGSDLFYFANRKAINLRGDSPQKCVACGNCGRGCRSGSVYKFSTHLLPQIRHLQNFRMLEQTRVIKIVPGTSISELQAIDEKNGDTFTIEADVVILCAGAIESPRLILNSNIDSIKTDQVGLYLQDHPRVAMGTSLMRLWFKPISEDRGYGDHLLLGGKINTQGNPLRFVAMFWSNFMKTPYYLPNLQFLPRFLREIIARQIYKNTAQSTSSRLVLYWVI